MVQHLSVTVKVHNELIREFGNIEAIPSESKLGCTIISELTESPSLSRTASHFYLTDVINQQFVV
jgi:hypothetical protein